VEEEEEGEERDQLPRELKCSSELTFENFWLVSAKKSALVDILYSKHSSELDVENFLLISARNSQK